MSEKIVKYKCPFYDECREGETYFAGGKPYLSIGGDPVCKGALFNILKILGEIVQKRGWLAKRL